LIPVTVWPFLASKCICNSADIDYALLANSRERTRISSESSETRNRLVAS
jgi:hypothetical protein